MTYSKDAVQFLLIQIMPSILNQAIRSNVTLIISNSKSIIHTLFSVCILCVNFSFVNFFVVQIKNKLMIVMNNDTGISYNLPPIAIYRYRAKTNTVKPYRYQLSITNN